MFIPQVFAHEVEEAHEVVMSLGDTTRANSIKFTIIASVVLIILVILSHFFKDKNAKLKLALFISILAIIVLTTLFLSISTIYLNINSETKGPVHYHADYEVWDCGRKVELATSKGLSNKVGTSTLHEHNDNRIHVEGVITDLSEASLGEFFEKVGGKVDSSGFEMPTNSGLVSRENGDICPDGKAGTLQVFVYSTDGRKFTQRKIVDPKGYVFSPQTQVPPGDCIIMEFGPEKLTTDKMCLSYKIAKETGKIYYGR